MNPEILSREILLHVSRCRDPILTFLGIALDLALLHATATAKATARTATARGVTRTAAPLALELPKKLSALETADPTAITTMGSAIMVSTTTTTGSTTSTGSTTTMVSTTTTMD